MPYAFMLSREGNANATVVYIEVTALDRAMRATSSGIGSPINR